jgi:hypothetical protein
VNIFLDNISPWCVPRLEISLLLWLFLSAIDGIADMIPFNLRKDVTPLSERCGLKVVFLPPKIELLLFSCLLLDLIQSFHFLLLSFCTKCLLFLLILLFILSVKLYSTKHFLDISLRCKPKSGKKFGILCSILFKTIFNSLTGSVQL